MSRNYAEKLRQIRKAEGMTQKVFSELTGLAIGTIKSYETGHQSARSEIVERVISYPQFEKYTLGLFSQAVYGRIRRNGGFYRDNSTTMLSGRKEAFYQSVFLSSLYHGSLPEYISRMPAHLLSC